MRFGIYSVEDKPKFIDEVKNISTRIIPFRWVIKLMFKQHFTFFRQFSQLSRNIFGN